MKKIISVLLCVSFTFGFVFLLSSCKDKNHIESDLTTTKPEKDISSVRAFLGENCLELYDSVIWDSIIKNPDRWGNWFTRLYDMDDEEKQSALEAGENAEWVSYNLFITVDNTGNESDVCLFGLDIPENGKEEVFINTSIENSTFKQIQALGKDGILTNVLVHNNDLSLDEVLGIIRSMDISVKCGPVPENFADGSGAEVIPEDDIVLVKVEK